MATIFEKPESPELTLEGVAGVLTKADFLLTIDGTENEAVAVALARSWGAPIFEGLLKTSYTIKKQGECLDVWDVVLSYGKLTTIEPSGGAGGPGGEGWNPAGDGFRFRFEIGTRTERRYVSKYTTKYGVVRVEDVPGIPVWLNPPDFGNSINVTDDNVEGVDVNVPTFNWSETYRLPVGTYLSLEYLTDLVNLMKTPVCADTFRVFNRGEVLWLGVQGAKDSQPTVELTFNFSAELNDSNIKIGERDGIDKEGWEYLWVMFEVKKDTDSKRSVRRPFAVYVERVYDYGDFSKLRIGSP